MKPQRTGKRLSVGCKQEISEPGRRQGFQQPNIGLGALLCPRFALFTPIFLEVVGCHTVGPRWCLVYGCNADCSGQIVIYFEVEHMNKLIEGTALPCGT